LKTTIRNPEYESAWIELGVVKGYRDGSVRRVTPQLPPPRWRNVVDADHDWARLQQGLSCERNVPPYIEVAKPANL